MNAKHLLRAAARGAGLVLLLIMASACQTGVYDGLRLSGGTTSTLSPSGYDVSPNRQVRVEAYNFSTNTWVLWRTGAVSSATPTFTMADGTELYAWSYSAAVLPAAYWSAGTGGSYARIRSYGVNSDGSRQNFLVARRDWVSCMVSDDFPGDLDGERFTLGYIVNNCFSHRSEAYVYTSGYREGPSTCAAPASTLPKTNDHYMLTQVPACAQKIIYDHMSEHIDRSSINNHYRIEHNNGALAHRTDNVGSCSMNAGGNCTLGGFFGGHTRYINKMQRHVMVYDYPWMPQGKIPSWDSNTTIPANFSGVSYGWRTGKAGPANCSSRDSSCTTGWLSSPAVSNPSPMRPRPPALATTDGTDPDTVPEICEVASPSALHSLTNGWHGGVHTTTGGAFASFDSPSFPLFYIWHNFVEDIWKDWKACGIAF